jgi:hypothetical protein
VLLCRRGDSYREATATTLVDGDRSLTGALRPDPPCSLLLQCFSGRDQVPDHLRGNPSQRQLGCDPADHSIKLSGVLSEHHRGIETVHRLSSQNDIHSLPLGPEERITRRTRIGYLWAGTLGTMVIHCYLPSPPFV